MCTTSFIGVCWAACYRLSAVPFVHVVTSFECFGKFVCMALKAFPLFRCVGQFGVNFGLDELLVPVCDPCRCERSHVTHSGGGLLCLLAGGCGSITRGTPCAAVLPTFAAACPQEGPHHFLTRCAPVHTDASFSPTLTRSPLRCRCLPCSPSSTSPSPLPRPPLPCCLGHDLILF